MDEGQMAARNAANRRSMSTIETAIQSLKNKENEPPPLGPKPKALTRSAMAPLNGVSAFSLTSPGKHKAYRMSSLSSNSKVFASARNPVGTFRQCQ